MVKLSDDVLERAAGRILRLRDTAEWGQYRTAMAAIEALEVVVRGAVDLEEFGLDTDDEIVNWAYSEAHMEFQTAIWNAASGFPKAGVACLRNAHEISTVSLYFQCRENENPEGEGYNSEFSNWTWGRADTPNWGTFKDYLSNVSPIARAQRALGQRLVDDAYKHFKLLCSYTHSRAHDGSGTPAQNLWMDGHLGEPGKESMEAFWRVFIQTVSWVATLWIAAFPQLARSCSEAVRGLEASYPQVLTTTAWDTVLRWARGLTQTELLEHSRFTKRRPRQP